ncbi:MAG: PQQ-binding-like beta-propeller repeat protein [Pirellulaceae bacterium]|nr:PQQ-binding-like beta-propeller repeat protein [Pirellulaceae bacterium]
MTEKYSAFLPKPRPLFPGWFARLLIAGPLLLVVLIRGLHGLENPPRPLNDSGLVNLLTLVFTGIAIITLLVWFCFRSGYSVPIRRGALGGVMALGLLFFACFRITDASGGMVFSVEPRWLPTADQRDAALPKPEPAIATGIDLQTTTPNDFPEFLGPGRRNLLPGPKLARDWSTPPKLLWKRSIGAGWSAFATVNGHAVTMEQRGPEEWVTCYEIATGKPAWGHAIQARHDNQTVLGGVGPRSTPTIAGGRVYAMGATGILRCLNGATGELLWQDDLLKRYGLTQAEDNAKIAWGRSGSPLVVDGMVIVPAGGKVPKSLVAFDAESGDLRWEAGTDQIGYSSPTLVTLAGTRQIASVNEKTASGHDVATGRVLWTHPWPGNSSGSANSSQPVPVGADQLLLSKGYSLGSELLSFAPAGSGTPAAPQSVWATHRVLQTKFTNVTLIGDYAYALSEGILECVEVASGKRQWKAGRYGHGQVLGVGELILVQAETGDVALVEANPKKFVELGQFPALDGKTWNNLCLVGNKLLVRNAEEAACYELGMER